MCIVYTFKKLFHRLPVASRKKKIRTQINVLFKLQARGIAIE